jgi:hypothetical protein
MPSSSVGHLSVRGVACDWMGGVSGAAVGQGWVVCSEVVCPRHREAQPCLRRQGFCHGSRAAADA